MYPLLTRPRDAPSPPRQDRPRAVGAPRRPLPVRGRPLLELGDPYFEANEVLGKFAGRAHLHQFFYTRSVNPSLSLCYLLRAFSSYGVKIVHGNFPSWSPFRILPPFTRRHLAEGTVGGCARLDSLAPGVTRRGRACLPATAGRRRRRILCGEAARLAAGKGWAFHPQPRPLRATRDCGVQAWTQA